MLFPQNYNIRHDQTTTIKLLIFRFFWGNVCAIVHEIPITHFWKFYCTFPIYNTYVQAVLKRFMHQKVQIYLFTVHDPIFHGKTRLGGWGEI